MLKPKTLFFLIALLFMGILMAGITLIGYFYNESGNLNLYQSHKNLKEVRAFGSKSEFSIYLAQANELTSFSYLGGLTSLTRENMMEDISMLSEEETSLSMENASVISERSSETNVQVSGIDEPDVVKTNGHEIFFSPEENLWYFDMAIDSPSVPDSGSSRTKAIKAVPPQDMKISGEIEESEELLLTGNVLVLFGANKIYGYNVADPAQMEKLWTLDIDPRSSYYEARLYQGKIYLITKTNIDDYSPCPIKPLSFKGDGIEIACTEIYHPVTPVPADATYNIMVLEPQNGVVEKKMAFVGSYNNSVVYMSPNYLYVTFTYPGDMVELMYSFLTEDGKDLFPQTVVDDMRKLKNYDISQQPKIMELGVIIDNYLNTLSEDEQLRVETDMQNKLKTYLDRRKRDIEKTAITKINIQDLSIEKTGEIPGKPLNQFSLDEYEGNLRIAVTLGEDMMFTENSANDLYVLDGELKQQGAVLDLGAGERIYSMRFIGNKGYMVTFKETDPFFVFDLKDAKNPRKVGELEIPGYSSYLHPLTDDVILGVGKEGEKVKLSLFGVADLANPLETAKYELDEYWTEILDTHHAFLQDGKHNIFFLPGVNGGYIFSYGQGKLELKKAMANIEAKRAVYIDDYLYIIGQNKIVALDESTWEEVKSLDF